MPTAAHCANTVRCCGNAWLKRVSAFGALVPRLMNGTGPALLAVGIGLFFAVPKPGSIEALEFLNLLSGQGQWVGAVKYPAVPSRSSS